MSITLTINEIPDYLHESDLYKNIESDDSFKVPEQYFKKEMVIYTFDDFVSYIRIFDYWMLDKYPKEMYIFIIKNKDNINMDILKEQFPLDDLIDEIKIIVETPDNKICDYFSSVGYLELLKYAHENGWEWDTGHTCWNAAENGHLECLKYCHENGCEWCEETCMSAAHNGHLECLKYAYENGCDWHVEEICYVAAKNNHFECLKYVREK